MNCTYKELFDKFKEDIENITCEGENKIQALQEMIMELEQEKLEEESALEEMRKDVRYQHQIRESKPIDPALFNAIILVGSMPSSKLYTLEDDSDEVYHKVCPSCGQLALKLVKLQAIRTGKTIQLYSCIFCSKAFTLKEIELRDG